MLLINVEFKLTAHSKPSSTGSIRAASSGCAVRCAVACSEGGGSGQRGAFFIWELDDGEQRE